MRNAPSIYSFSLGITNGANSVVNLFSVTMQPVGRSTTRPLRLVYTGDFKLGDIPVSGDFKTKSPAEITQSIYTVLLDRGFQWVISNYILQEKFKNIKFVKLFHCSFNSLVKLLSRNANFLKFLLLKIIFTALNSLNQGKITQMGDFNRKFSNS